MNILGLINVPDFLVLLGIVLTVVYFRLTRNHGVFRAMGVPGPRPLPWYGNKAEGAMSVNERYTQLREKYGKIFGLFFGQFPVLIFGELELVRQIMVKEFSTFRNRMTTQFDFAQVPPITLILFSLRGDYWKTIRTIITPTFTSGKIKQMIDAMNTTSKTLVSCLKEPADKKEEIIARDFTGSFSMDTIASIAFGVDLDCQTNPEDKFVKNLGILLHGDKTKKFKFPSITAYAVLIFPFLAPLVHKWTCFMGWKNAFGDDAPIRFLENSVNETLAMRQTSNKKYVDYLQLLVDAKISSSSENPDEDDDDQMNGVDPKIENGHSPGQPFRKLTRDELVGQCIMFFIAGHETTATGLMFSFYNLALFPEVQERIFEEINEHVPQDSDPAYEALTKCQYMEMFLMETLRLYPPVVAVNRTASSDVRIGHYFIPKGTIVSLPIWQIHHDPEFWENPEVFDPERFLPEKVAKHHPAQWLPFGLGPRLCVGKRLAMVEMKVALIHVMRKYKFSKSENTEIPVKLGKNDFLLADLENPIKLCIETREA